MRLRIRANHLVVLLSGAAAGALALEPPARAARPLAGQVLIRRDTFGLPHIFGETDEAAAFGLGYAQAEDHLEPLARRLIQARGAASSRCGRCGSRRPRSAPIWSGSTASEKGPGPFNHSALRVRKKVKRPGTLPRGDQPCAQGVCGERRSRL